MSRAEPMLPDKDLWELKAVLDEELSRLPEKIPRTHRPVRTPRHEQKEVARRLGCLEGTLSSRLARARKRLHVRLVKRGLTLSAGAMAVACSEDIAAGAVAIPLVVATVRMGLSVGLAAGINASNVPAKVAALTEGVFEDHCFWANSKSWQLSRCILPMAAGGTLTHQAVSARQTDAPAPESTKAAQTKPKDQT